MAAASASALLGFVAPARAFDTGPHADITVDALRSEGFSASAADIVRVENWFVDLYSQEDKVPQSGHSGPLERIAAFVAFPENWPKRLIRAVDRLHFDHGPVLVNGGVEPEWDRLRRVTWALAREAERRDDPLQLLAVLGISLHELQDFYSHSNWMEPRGEPGFAGPGWAALGQGDAPTWFDVPRGIRAGAEVHTNGTPGRRRHGHWQSNGNEHLEGAIAKDWPGRPLYEQAHMAAYFATRQWVRAVREWVSDDAFWRRAQRLGGGPALARDVRGSEDVSQYSGHWQGQGGPCNPKEGCDVTSGPGGSVVHLRQAVNGFFERGRSRYRRAFERLAMRMADPNPRGELGPVESSRAIQEQTRFVKLQVLSMRGIDVGDPGPDDADFYARATILGQDYLSAVIHGRDSYGFPRPNYPFTWLRAVPGDYTGGEPVTEITVRIRTSSARFAGTDDDVYLRLGPGLRFPLDKRLYDDFERGDDDTYSVSIDQAARAGLRVGDVRELRIEKGRDRPGGAWKLRGVTLRVNGRVVYLRDGIERWLEGNRRTWAAGDFRRRSPTGKALPVWLDLQEDDLVYGADDAADINRLDRRRAVAVAYELGTVVERTVTGGKLHGGRLGDGGVAALRFRLKTLTPRPPPPEPLPPPPPPQRADLVIAVDSMSFTVRNIGAGDAGPFTVTVVGFGTFRMAGLRAGQQATMPYTTRCSEGTREARVDSLDEVAESDETNNLGTAMVIC